MILEGQGQVCLFFLEETASRAMTDLENLFFLYCVFVTNNGAVFCELYSNLSWCLWLSCVCLRLSIWLMLQIVDS